MAELAAYSHSLIEGLQARVANLKLSRKMAKMSSMVSLYLCVLHVLVMIRSTFFACEQIYFSFITRRCGYLPGGMKVLVAVCTVCCCSTCEALSPQVVVDRVPSYARGPGGKITKGSIVFQSD